MTEQAALSRPVVSSNTLLSTDRDRSDLRETAHSEASEMANLVESEAAKLEDHYIDKTKKRQASDRKFEWLQSPVLKQWDLELLACLLSLGAVVAIAVTLRTHDGLPVPRWPLGISLNALVAIYAIILKGGMMFAVTAALSQLKWSWFQISRPLGDLQSLDLASRGPWNSLLLFIRVRGVHLASLGAFITILSIASDPFIQQVAQTSPCARETDEDTATVPRVNFYRVPFQSTPRYITDYPAAEAAIYKGIHNSFSPVHPDCTSANCTFPNFRTVGMCHKCRDMTHVLTKTHGGTCNGTWELPSGLNISWPPVKSSGNMEMRPISLLQDFPYNTDVILFQNITDYQNAANHQNVTDFPCSASSPPKTPLVVRCAFYPCVRTYSTSINSSMMIEHLLAKDAMSEAEQFPLGLSPDYSLSPMPCLINGTFYNESAFTTTNWTNNIPIWGFGEHNQTLYLYFKASRCF